MNKHKGQTIEEKIKCTDCKAEDYLTPEERAKLNAYMENGGTFEDLPLKTRRILEQEANEVKVDEAIESQHHSHGGGVYK